MPSVEASRIAVPHTIPRPSRLHLAEDVEQDPIAGHIQAIMSALGEALVEVLKPRAVAVIAQARHLCVAMRGVQSQHSATATRALRGLYADDAQARQDVLAMLQSEQRT